MSDGKCGTLDKQKLLALALPFYKKLRILKLRENDIGPKGAKALAPSFEKMTNMHTLHLGSNDLNDDAKDTIRKAVVKRCRVDL